MADGLIKLGKKRILPPPTPSVMAAIGLAGGGGDPGGGFMEPSVALSGILLPNGTGNVGYEGLESSADFPITAREFTGSDSALSSGEEDTISVDDDNYIEVTNTFFPVAAGHRVEFDVSAYTPEDLQLNVQGYGYEDNGPSYQYIAGFWDYVSSDYAAVLGHVQDSKTLIEVWQGDIAKFISGGDLVSTLMQGLPWGNGVSATTHTLTYYAELEVYE